MHYTKHNLQRSLQTYKNEISVNNNIIIIIIIIILCFYNRIDVI